MKGKYQYRNINNNPDFKCLHCRGHVTADSTFSGVVNRNHCPYCLFSRHLDLYQAGDRLAACKGQMRPVGLAIKKTNKKYGGEKQGELMLVHLCNECHKVSINRIAADDHTGTLYEVFIASHRLDAVTQAVLQEQQFRLLAVEDEWLVHSRLFGNVDKAPSYAKY